MLQVIAGYDHNDEGTAAVPVPDYSKASGLGIKGLRIGIIPDFTFHAVDPQVETAVKAALRKMEQMGASVFEIPIEHKEDQLAAQLIVEACEPSTYHQQWLRQRPGDYGDDVRLLLELGELHFASQYLQAQRYRNVLRKEMNDAFKHVDVFVSPTIPFTVNKVRSDAASVEDSVEEDLTLSMKFTNIPSLTGLPAINIPCGFDADGLPIGMQIIGKPFDEETLFRVGSAFQGNI
jgi:aspartyl-tRNA(Asn)/glutamyl-tRNA(Gln) amidotransferase subunit A